MVSLIKQLKPSRTAHFWAGAAALALTLSAQTSHAAGNLICELVDATCTDSATRYSGYGEPIPTPVIQKGQACWSWSNSYKCVDSNSDFKCTGEGTTVSSNVAADCALIGGTINSYESINGRGYVTSGTYDYACEFPKLVDPAQPPLPPPNKTPASEVCVLLETRVFFTEDQAADVAQVYGDQYIVGSQKWTPVRTLGYKSSTEPTTTTVPPTLVPLDKTIKMRREVKTEFVCYDAPIEECTDTCYEPDPNTPSSGTLPALTPVACQAPLDKESCFKHTEICDGTYVQNDPDSGRLEQGPDGRCVAQTTIYYCPMSDAPACLNNPDCEMVRSSFDSTGVNGMPTSMEQVYECSTTTRTCEEVGLVDSCTTSEAWGLDDFGTTQKLTEGLNEANGAMAKVEGIQKGMSEDDVFIFSGQDLRCRYPVGTFLNSLISIAFSLLLAYLLPGGALLAQLLNISNAAAIAIGAAISLAQDIPNSKAFGKNCCEGFMLEGSDKWWKLGKCTADEVKLAVARSKNLAVKIGGDYCSKRGGFPLRECKEKTKTYCVFDDMLALTINEQGRIQLDELASLGGGTTSVSPDTPIEMFAEPAMPDAGYPYRGMNNGRWERAINYNGSDIYTWKYPYYCRTLQAQDDAFTKYIAEVNQAVDMTGLIPPKDEDGKYILTNLTVEQKKLVAAKLVDVPPFQECASIPGLMTFMTCTAGTSCDKNRFPYSPDGEEYDEFGKLVGPGPENLIPPDPRWRIQQVRSFYQPGDYGTDGVMPSNASFAKASNALSEKIAANGSCKEGTGNCLYNFTVSSGNPRRTVRETVRFPLYSLSASPEYPTINYMPVTGGVSMGAYMADPNRGRGNPVELSKQRYIFHPNWLLQAPAEGIHQNVLLEWAYQVVEEGEPHKDFVPLNLPTKLPIGTAGWWPHSASGVDANGAPVPYEFYISGGCDEDSKWCEYEIVQELRIERHPWGTNRAPRCWGFTIDQMAVLDFDAMDLSKWINSLNLDDMAAGLPDSVAADMAGKVTSSAQTFYSAMGSGSNIQAVESGNQVLILSNDTLPDFKSEPFEAYVLEVAIPSNWPRWYREGEGTNDNPVTSATVDFGRTDADTTTPLQKTADGKAWQVMSTDKDGNPRPGADLGNYPVGTYKVTVKAQTAKNGEQILSQYVRVTPYYGKMPDQKTMDFSGTNINEAPKATVDASTLKDGAKMDKQGVTDTDGKVRPGLSPLYGGQGDQVTPVQLKPNP